MNIAIIPARGGSKRIPRKNIKIFAGKPMITYAIEAAKNSGLFEHIIVTTDDQEIANIALDLGAEVPFMRPSDISDDYTPTVPVIAHAINECQNLGWKIENACCIYANVPLIEVEDLKEGFLKLHGSDADYSFPIAEYPSAIQRALKKMPDDKMTPFNSDFELTRTQDLETAYYDAGQFYWGSSKSWLSNEKIHSSSVGHLIPSWRVIDIDTESDWKRAEYMYDSINKIT